MRSINLHFTYLLLLTTGWKVNKIQQSNIMCVVCFWGVSHTLHPKKQGLQQPQILQDPLPVPLQVTCRGKGKGALTCAPTGNLEQPNSAQWHVRRDV